MNSLLGTMFEEVKMCEAGKQSTEPETRVKRTIYRTLAQKFKEVLRHSTQIQNEFKTGV